MILSCCQAVIEDLIPSDQSGLKPEELGRRFSPSCSAPLPHFHSVCIYVPAHVHCWRFGTHLFDEGHEAVPEAPGLVAVAL